MNGIMRRLVWCAICFALVAIAWLLWPSDPITESTYHKLLLGMTLGEVEEVVGMPARDVNEAARIATEKRRLQWIRIDRVMHEGNDFTREVPDLSRIKAWQSHLSVLTVQLGDDGRVIGKHFEERHRMSVFAEIRTWFGL
jgi:hypothetical protein